MNSSDVASSTDNPSPEFTSTTATSNIDTIREIHRPSSAPDGRVDLPMKHDKDGQDATTLRDRFKTTKNRLIKKITFRAPICRKDDDAFLGHPLSGESTILNSEEPQPKKIARQHKKLFSILAQRYRKGENAIICVGNPGTGKSTILNSMIGRLPPARNCFSRLFSSSNMAVTS